MGDNITFYVVDEERLIQLLEAENWLRSLQIAGVDNWEGISFAYDEHQKIKEVGDRFDRIWEGEDDD